jgi:hypothetical protein
MKTQERIREPYLIQRLKKPFKEQNQMTALSGAFSFGGGKIRGGLSKEAWDLLSKIWRYDYMGSSEFEWGAVPKSLETMVQLLKEKKLIKFEMPVTAKCYNYGSRKDLTGTKTVYVVCNGDFKTEINDKGFHTKESVCLADSICDKEYHIDTVGWHDIDNHYLFFTDKEMFDNFCELFELK